MTIDEVYKSVKYLTNKFGYNISPSDFNLMWPQKEISYFNVLYKQYGLNQQIGDSLSKFTQSVDLVINGTGKYVIPADLSLLHIDAITHILNGVPVEVKRVEKDRIANNLSSSYDFPTAEFPIYTQYNNFLQFYPTSLANATMVYLFQPAPSKWSYTLTNGRPVYDSANSTDPLWLNTDISKIIYLLLEDIGISNRDQELGQYGMVQEKSTT